MSKHSRRRKAPPVSGGRQTFIVVIDTQEIVVDYRPHWLDTDYGHFEFRSPHGPARPIPVSETGYRSYFAAMEDVEAAASPQDFAREIALALLRSRRTVKDEPGQLSLF